MIEERKATGVHLDPRCGHVTITGDSGPALVTMVDTGQHLELWSHQGAHMSPNVARMLAKALADWADLKAWQAVVAAHPEPHYLHPVCRCGADLSAADVMTTMTALWRAHLASTLRDRLAEDERTPPAHGFGLLRRAAGGDDPIITGGPCEGVEVVERPMGARVIGGGPIHENS